MITNPSTDSLVLTVAENLSEIVAPAVSDPEAALTLQHAIAALQWVAARCSDEERCIKEEIERISFPYGLSKDRSPSDGGPSDTTTDYIRASHRLNATIDAAFDALDSEDLASVVVLLTERLANEARMLQISNFIGRGS
jgi:hypothetical protein